MRFLPLLSSLMSLASLDLGGAVSRQAKGLGYTLVTILFLLTAYVLGVCALAFYLSRQMGTWGALGAIALGFVGAAGLVFWFGTRSARAEAQRAGEVASARQKATLGTLAGLALGGGSTKMLIIAALAGVLAGGLLDSRGKPGSDD
jgi:hypothetical protein